jgi:small-conductance mechanosensitive channel
MGEEASALQELFRDLIQNPLPSLIDLVAAIVTFVATLIVASLATQWIKRAVKKQREDPELIEMLGRLTRWAIIVIGTMLALEQVNFNVTSFLAGLGVAGFTIGFALQDIARNFVAGILLLIRQPFNIGEAVEIAGGFSGQVMDVNIRDTVIKTWDGEEVILPNIDVFGNPILNYSARPYRRRTVTIGIGYGEEMEKAMQAFLETVKEIEGVLETPPPEILAEELGSSTLNVALRFWVNQRTHGLFDVHSKVVIALNACAEEKGIDLPYPIQTVHVEQS